MIKKFLIKDLFREKNIELFFDRRSVIMTGDNGNGKTTILNILYNVLTGNIHELLNCEFSESTVQFDNNFKIVKKIHVRKSRKDDKKIKVDYFFDNLKEADITLNCEYNSIFDRIFIDYDLSKSESDDLFDQPPGIEKGETLLNFLNENGDKVLYEKLKKINESLLYFPTYRRIDIDVEEYFDMPYNPFLHSTEKMNYSNFGLIDRRVVGISNSDIKEILTTYSKEINEVTSENLDDLLKSFVKEFITSIMEDDGNSMTFTMNNIGKKVILDRLVNINQTLGLNIDSKKIEDFTNYYYKSNSERNSMLNKIIKNEKGRKISDNETLMKLIDMRTPWIEYLGILETLYEDYQAKLNQELESFIYISKNLADFSGRKINLIKQKNNELVFKKENDIVDFSILSTGEKQLITFLVYCAVHLPNKEPSLVIIDEPELSLHVKWQNKLLMNLLSKENIKILSATHSPFILNKDMNSKTVRLVAE